MAILAATGATLVALFLGDALLVPVTEVGSMASAAGWFVACLSLLLVESRFRVRIVAATGAVVALLLVSMKLISKFPGHFSQAEWVALAVWLLIGAALHSLRPAAEVKSS